MSTSFKCDEDFSRDSIKQLPVCETDLLYATNNPRALVMNSRNSLEIVLTSNTIFFRSTGADIEPATLQGNVILYLTEATPFKEITMHLHVKSRVLEDPSIFNGITQTNILYTHDWSFLDGHFTHTPILRAGRHVFPFQLQLDNSLPSSLSCHAGFTGVDYGLRATAVRTLFASNLHTSAAFRVVRSFAPESLSYQQTLEVENTWPEKLLYSLLIPHKAWAAGDTLSILVKFSPLIKGVTINRITTTVQELLRTCTGVGLPHEENRVIAIARHQIRDGRAVTHQHPDPAGSFTAQDTATCSTSSSDGAPEGGEEGLRSIASHPFTFPDAQFALHGAPNTSSSPTQTGVEFSSARCSHADSCILYLGDEEIVTTLTLPLPVTATPSHALEPIIVSHRIRWNILISNPDGHISELRCALPLHILDRTLLPEARLATVATRQMLFGPDDSQPYQEETNLPSYPAHVLDRVVDAYVPPVAVHVQSPPRTGESRRSVTSTAPGSPPLYSPPQRPALL